MYCNFLLLLKSNFNKFPKFFPDILPKVLNKTVKYMRLKFPYEIRNGNSSLKARFLTVNEQN